jgi:hypothetical protein
VGFTPIHLDAKVNRTSTGDDVAGSLLGFQVASAVVDPDYNFVIFKGAADRIS